MGSLRGSGTQSPLRRLCLQPLTLEALRRTVGDEDFYEILRAYIGRYRGANATTEDFISLSESISGQDLDSFFDRWLYEKKLPPLP